MLLESLLSKLAAAGLATKAAAGGTAVVLAASAAGAADALPEPAQDAFDGLVATETVELEEDTELEGETDGNAEFGQRVSQDATGESDGEPGVDGAEIACEASEGRSGNCEEASTDDASGDDADGEGNFGARVSADATGESDGEPGVDGEEISSEARARNPGKGEKGVDDAPADTDEGDDDEDDADEDDDADGGPEGTPGESAANPNRPGDQG